MKLRTVNVTRVVDAFARMRASGYPAELNKIETHFLASGGEIEQLVRAVEYLGSKRRPVDWWDLACVDLAGMDPEAVVRAGVEPGKVIGNATLSSRFRKSARSQALE